MALAAFLVFGISVVRNVLNDVPASDPLENIEDVPASAAANSLKSSPEEEATAPA